MLPTLKRGYLDMDKLFAVIRREYMERVRTKWFLIATIFGPVFFGALMILPGLLASRGKASAEGTNIAIIDATAVGLGDRIALNLAGGATGSASIPTVQSVPASEVAQAESLATAGVMNGSIVGYLVVDSSTLTSDRARYAGKNTTALFDMQRIQRSVQREIVGLRIAESGIDPETGRRISSVSVNVETERLSNRGRGGSGMVNLFVGLAVAMLLYMTIFIYGLNVLRGVLEEKQTRVAEVVIASVSATKLLAGKVIGVGGVGLTQLALWLGMSYVMYTVRQPLLASFGVNAAPFVLPDIGTATLLLLLAFFLLGFMLYAGLFAAAGATVSSEQEAQQVQMPIILLLVSSIMFVQNFMMNPDGGFSRVMSMLPWSASIVMPLRMTVSPVPTAEIIIALASVTVGAVLSVLVAARIYRVGLLMYGKRAGFGEVLRWIRQR